MYLIKLFPLDLGRFLLISVVMSNEGTTASVQHPNVMQTTTFKDAALNANRHSRMEPISIFVKGVSKINSFKQALQTGSQLEKNQGFNMLCNVYVQFIHILGTENQ